METLCAAMPAAAGRGRNSYATEEGEHTMSDLSLPHCEKCGRVEYDCVCDDGPCCECGEKLTKEEREAGRDICFDCYLEGED